MVHTALRAFEHWLHGNLVALRGHLRGSRLEVAAGRGEQALGRAQWAQVRMHRRLRRDLTGLRARLQIRLRSAQLRRVHLRARR
jgi:hypothetical protein